MEKCKYCGMEVERGCDNAWDMIFVCPNTTFDEPPETDDGGEELPGLPL